MNNEFEILQWDSNYFGYGVAKITKEDCDYNALIDILTDLKNKNIRLVYWAFNVNKFECQKASDKAKGFLADKKTTFYRTLPHSNDILYENNKQIVEYSGTPSKELLDLAVLSGKYSRFKVDKKISLEKFEGLYRQWMINSVNKKVADVVFVNFFDNKIVGMVTVQKKDETGIIGLVAVDENMQGKNLGKELVKASLHWSKENGCNIARVVTQYDNKPACRLYEKCGYSIEKIENFYHFWL